MRRAEFVRWLLRAIQNAEGPADYAHRLREADDNEDEAIAVTVSGSTFIVRVEGPFAVVGSAAEVVDVLVGSGQL